MVTELNLRFPDRGHVIVSFDGEESGAAPFADPISAKDRADLRWYLEVYGAHSLGDPDDGEAARIAARLPECGKALFDAAFGDRAAARLFHAFQDAADDARLLTVTAEHPAILALPWELLHDPAAGGVFLFSERPRISIRRRVAGARGGRASFKPQPKARAHLLFVVSRPTGSGFLDPRADAAAVLDALDAHAPGQCTWEFLRPPTLDALVARLDDDEQPPVDILHFDGHGVFDRQGGLPERLRDRSVDIAQALAGETTRDTPGAAASPANTGYLLFETAERGPDLVPAEKLGVNLHRRRVPLVILSACQSAAQGDGDEPLGSVAARLTAAGIPAVLAMSHSVLVPTTRALFGEFYKQLARRRTVGEALDAARVQLYNHPEKYDVQRGADRVPLRLHDWFVPALYQSAADVPLIEKPDDAAPAARAPRTNVRARPEAGFFGRRRELWDIERWLAGRTRRVTVTGFGGQGKTALAHEAARWLLRTGQFRAAAFVDYSRAQTADAVTVAASTIGSVLGESLADEAAVAGALGRAPTLVILDNLEALGAEPLRELLDAAKAWSEAGGSRVLLTTRAPDFGHPDYAGEGTLLHRRVVLAGLGNEDAPDDALAWFAELSKLPPAPTAPAPAREALVALFDRVRFHPLSIRVLAQQLKTRRPAELGTRLGQLLAEGGDPAGVSPAEATLPELVASLRLSLDRLDDAARAVLPRLGVFQGGAFEDDLLAITGLGDPHLLERQKIEAVVRRLEARDPVTLLQLLGANVPDDAEVPADVMRQLTAAHFDEAAAQLGPRLAAIPAPPAEANVWPGVRRQLEAASLLEAEAVPDVLPPFLRFHPTLAPMLARQLGAEERERFGAAHRKRYAALAVYLYENDGTQPLAMRAVAHREMPNLLHAAHAAFAANEPGAVSTAMALLRFLNFFGLARDAERLTRQIHAASPEYGSRPWLLALQSEADELKRAGRPDAAAALLRGLLDHLGGEPSFDRAVNLLRLARCYEDQRMLALAAAQLREGLAVMGQLEQTRDARLLTSTLHADLGDVLQASGLYADARREYEASLAIKKAVGGDVRGEGVVLGQLGSLAMQGGEFGEALTQYRRALALFQQLGEPQSEAVAWHQLGVLFQRVGQYDDAEQHYRRSAQLEAETGNVRGAAQTWHQLATLSHSLGKREAAETWYRKALGTVREVDAPASVSRSLRGLAGVLTERPGGIAEARQLAEEALAIDQTLDPSASQIWKTYEILARVTAGEAAATADARRQAELRAQSGTHRQRAREEKWNFVGTWHELSSFAPLIAAVATVARGEAGRDALDPRLADLERRGWTKLVEATRRVIAGERDVNALWEELDLEDSMAVRAMLAVIADPSALARLLPTDDAPDDPGDPA